MLFIMLIRFNVYISSIQGKLYNVLINHKLKGTKDRE